MAYNPDIFREYYLKNKEKYARKTLLYYRNNKEKIKEYRKQRGNSRDMVISLLMERDGNICGVCQKELYLPIEVDHIVPVSAGGNSNADNIHLTHKLCNRQKKKIFRKLT